MSDNDRPYVPGEYADRLREYQRMREYVPRYQHERQCCLRTMDGCEKRIDLPREQNIHRESVRIGRPVPTRSGDFQLGESQMYIVRTYTYEGQQTRDGLRIFDEIPPAEAWEQKYKELYEQIYGVDKGL